ncbi:TPA: hypothetical protein ACTUT5_001126 [Legionella anisa]|uniref:Uncharacterized protein n=2 Tax=Legionella anisa TaxID=28082 RepID=A0AAX0WV07_9GAMM|nr:hypothetical protein [Legionella anisa]AWN73643.1 hypothetical protein DLD14_07225 [Legionella anisa]MBN5935603.1 hypothetical protein [Legionella anisa]MCW8426536.1 condensin complex subunit 2 [Legionella anisa]MCW8448199.1 condensin complex subunit 2 [Legionella anisa]PNL62447.1 hypothetical protein A6J39_015180 [Legionella anisa]
MLKYAAIYLISRRNGAMLMLEKYLHKGINFKRAAETLDAGIKLAKQANEAENDPTLVQQTKDKVQELISEYTKIYTSSSLWAVKQTKLIQELRQKMTAEQPQLDEPELANGISLRR